MLKSKRVEFQNKSKCRSRNIQARIKKVTLTDDVRHSQANCNATIKILGHDSELTTLPAKLRSIAHLYFELWRNLECENSFKELLIIAL